jgi:hypothetical protein
MQHAQAIILYITNTVYNTTCTHKHAMCVGDFITVSLSCYLFVCVCVCVCVCVYIYNICSCTLYMYACICMYVCLFVCLYVYANMYTRAHTHTQTRYMPSMPLYFSCLYLTLSHFLPPSHCLTALSLCLLCISLSLSLARSLARSLALFDDENHEHPGQSCRDFRGP